ncbi:MAG: arylsulfatase [Erythrobacter sp. SCN 62-14]|nr:MAG: arylsulfatase [Erythrobacter sp. SCN 62-14]
MRKLIFLVIAAALGNLPALAAHESAAEKRPNFLIIVADDLGFSDIGAFGGEIATPNLDRLALQGVRLTDFHTAPTCSPTRAMLLTGADHHVAGLGTMAELQAPNQRGLPGYEGYLRRDVATIAERLAPQGYRTLFSGKWHLGLTDDQDPFARGFQYSFALRPGAHNHFGVDLTNPLTGAPNYSENGKALSSLPQDFYSSDAFAERLIGQLRNSTSTDQEKKPFFGILAFTAPHWPLQAPPEDIARYRGEYDAGFEALRQRRIARQEELGLIGKGINANPPKLPGGSWDELSADQQAVAIRDMEIYAAMVHRLDQAIGKVLDELERTGEFDNTVIIFMSDNGAEGLDPEGSAKALLAPILALADNRLDNRGAASSYVLYGPGWAQAATAPRWLIKGYATDGGTRVPAFVHWPASARRGEVAATLLHVSDIVPTVLDLAGVSHEALAPSAELAWQPITGRSWAEWLQGLTPSVRSNGDALGVELFGSRALRQGEWKITDIGDGQWRLFHLAGDPGETRDLAATNPAKLAELAQLWDEYAKTNNVVIPTEARYRP